MFKKNHKTRSVIFFPDWRKGNPYQSLLAAGIEKNNYSVNYLNYKSESYFPIFSALKHNTLPDIVHLHWIAPYLETLFWSSNALFVYLRLLFIGLDIIILKLHGIKVVWTVHNLISHESPNIGRELLARKIIAMLCRVVVHSEGAQLEVANKYNICKEKIKIVPHGNYIGYYKSDASECKNVKSKLGLNKDCHVFLFLGGIRRYKGVNELVEAFLRTTNPNFNLVIAGQPFDEEDNQWLRKNSQNDLRIKLSLGFIPESEVFAYMDLCDVVVLPFVNTLTSGSAILAMSCGKALILPEKGSIFSLPSDGIIYYSESQGLEWALKESENRNLKAMGNFNLNFIQDLSFDKTANLLIEKAYT